MSDDRLCLIYLSAFYIFKYFIGSVHYFHSCPVALFQSEEFVTPVAENILGNIIPVSYASVGVNSLIQISKYCERAVLNDPFQHEYLKSAEVLSFVNDNVFYGYFWV